MQRGPTGTGLTAQVTSRTGESSSMIRRIFIACSIVVSLILGLYVAAELYWQVKYIDETITSGEKWGVRIGDTPAESIARLQKELSLLEAHVLLERHTPPRHVGLGPISMVTADQLSNVDSLTVFLEDEALSFLSLEFRQGRLVSAYRKQRAFELP